MKSLFIAIVMMVSFLSQTTQAAEPHLTPRIVRSFETTFSEAEDVQWSTVENLYKVNFTLDDRRMFAFYNAEGELVVTGRYLSVKHLPKAAQKKLSEEAKGYTITEVFEINEGLNSKYYVNLNSANGQKVIESFGGKWSTFKKSSK